jgi:hypothetical protein
MSEHQEQEVIIPTRRVSYNEFLKELTDAKDWLLWVNPAIEELELMIKDGDGNVYGLHGPQPLDVNIHEYNKFLVEVKDITDQKPV